MSTTIHSSHVTLGKRVGDLPSDVNDRKKVSLQSQDVTLATACDGTPSWSLNDRTTFGTSSATNGSFTLKKEVRSRAMSLHEAISPSISNLTPQSVLKLKEIFKLFDPESTGYVTATNLQKLHDKLGEPITLDEANEALRFINPSNGKVDFFGFIKWWSETVLSQNDNICDSMRRYQAKFKFIKARIANPIIGRIETESSGTFPSIDYRINFFYRNDDGSRTRISPWHDIPLYNSDGTVNFICEIPKWTRKKMEIATKEVYNPIKQDLKNGKLREYSWGDMMFNYGALPQTWEDPEHVTEGTGCVGDNDPIDVVEIGTKQWAIGSIVQVKILGVLALIDSDETDWKLIAINIEDTYASKIHNVADIEAHMPGCINAIHNWLRDYKSPNVNKYGYNGECKDRAFAEACVAETHHFWKKIVDKNGRLATVE